MAERTIHEQLVKYLTDAHSIEEQALQQLRTAPKIAGDPDLAEIYSTHLAETERQEQRIRERLEALGERPSRLKDTAMRAGGTGFTMFARFQPDTPGKLHAHSYSYEHLEQGAYELLRRAAERAGDVQTAELATDICREERRMGDRLSTTFDQAVTASLREVGRDDMEEQLVKYLADAHAIEAQAIALLEKGADIIGDEGLATALSEHLEETRKQQRLIEERLGAHGAKPSWLKDAGLRLGALNWGGFFQAQPDTPGKLAAFAFAFEHLEIAGYEQLRRVAELAGDAETKGVAERILAEERRAAARIAERWDEAADASLAAQEVRA